MPAQVWDQVRRLWEEQSGGKDDWIIVQASGLVHQAAAVYDLEIYGLFQRYFKADPPDLREIADWCRLGVEFRCRYKSPLLFKGQVSLVSVNDMAREFGGWSVAPAVGRTDVTSPMRWQYWRMYRSLWLPAPYITNSVMSFGVEGNSLVIRDSKAVIGRWNDWTDRLSERITEEIPPATGQYLQISRAKLEQFTQDTGSVFCWVCRLTGWHREHRYDAHKSFVDYRDYGSTRIFRG